MGETQFASVILVGAHPFSILKRIVMGETLDPAVTNAAWVNFQYPQADRDG